MLIPVLLIHLIFVKSILTIQNFQVLSSFHISIPVVEYNFTISFTNDQQDPIDTYRIGFPSKYDNQIRLKLFDSSLNQLPFEILKQNDTVTFYDVNLIINISSNDSGVIIGNLMVINAIIPVHKSRNFNEDQLLMYDGFLTFFSPYLTNYYRIEINTELDIIDSTSDDLELVNKDQMIYELNNIPPYSVANNIRMIFMNNDPLPSIDEIIRNVYVSHFGKIVVREHVFCRNYGARTAGNFIHKLTAPQKNVISKILIHLPESAENIKLFDELGFNFKLRIEHPPGFLTIAAVTPRYPLMGGWKTDFILEYTMAAYEYIRFDQFNNYLINFTLNPPIYEGIAAIRKISLEIVLPEGVELQEIQNNINCNYSVEISTDKSLYVFGNPSIRLEISNLMELDEGFLEIFYSYQPIYLFQKAYLMIFYLEIVFSLYIVYRYFSR